LHVITECSARRRIAEAALEEWKAGCLVVTALPNVRYLTGFTGSNGIVVIAPGRSVLFTDPRYTLQAAGQCDLPTRTVKGQLLPAVINYLTRSRIRHVGFEKERVSYLTHAFLKEKLPAHYELVPVSQLIENHRMIKSEAEIDLIRNSVQLNSKAFEKALGRFRSGMTELELAAEIDFQMRKYGAEANAFETIVASGSRSALPHARPSQNPIGANQLLLIDMGASLNGYASDMTRTVFTGRPSSSWKRNYKAVLDAQRAGIASIRHGVPSVKPDREARRVLQTSGLDKAFTHSTGHGLGLEIHEAPRLGKRDKGKLLAGMVVTVEPGVYLQDQGGIRIEDTVLVTQTGCEILTPTSKDLRII
jgi:Xaa-Pro aminopeptidase